MNASPAIVYLVDDDASFLKALSRLLRAAGLMVESFSSAEEFLRQLPGVQAGCVLADLSMPGLSGLDLQTALAKAENPLPIIFLTGHGDIPTSVQAMRHGAEDFLTKTAPRDVVLAAVQRALTRDTRERTIRDRQRAVRDRFRLLSQREMEVLAQVLQGRLNKQIGDALGIHERTVKLHRTSITTKLGVNSVAELTRLAEQAGLFEEAAFQTERDHGAVAGMPSIDSGI